MAEGVADGVIRHLMEDDALMGHLLEPRRLDHVPGDRLPLAVGVGRQEELLRPFGRLLQLAHDRLLLFGDEVLGQEVALDVDAEL